MAFAHHDAAHSDERRGCKTPLFSTEQAGDGDVAARANLTISLHGDTATKVVEHERPMRLGEAKLSRETRVLDTRPARCTGATVMPSDEEETRERGFARR